jgi:hypothetical protein
MPGGGAAIFPRVNCLSFFRHAGLGPNPQSISTTNPVVTIRFLGAAAWSLNNSAVGVIQYFGIFADQDRYQ